MGKEAVQQRLAQLMERYVLHCTVELFTAYDLPVVSVPAPSALPVQGPGNVAGIVGFVGDVCGTLLLNTSVLVSASSHPLRSKAGILTERMRFDWVGELANQLMGRLKLRIADHGVNIRVSAPISIAGDRLRHVGVSGQTCRAEFRAGSSEIQVWVDADIRNSLLWSEAFFEDRELEPSVEGTVTFL